jgi:hypothetical protein
MEVLHQQYVQDQHENCSQAGQAEVDGPEEQTRRQKF